jgi:hypothetical protein
MNEFIARNGLIALDNSTITGSLNVTGNITGSFFTGSFRGDGSGLTGVGGDPFPYTGLAIISGSLEVTDSISSSIFSGSFVGDGSQLTGISAGFPFTGSATILGSLIVDGNIVADSFTGSFQGTVTTASYIEYANVANKPTLVSGSSQIIYSGISGIPAGIVSGSSQITYSGISGIPSGIVSGSSQVSYTGLSNIPAGIVSGSTQIAALGFATTSSNTFRADQTITGSLFISQNLIVAGSSSIQYISSSTLNITDNVITVNAFNPGVRFGGLAVIDSGSSPQVSGSLLFDSIKDQWIFIHENPSVTTSSVLLMGPETYNNLGNETYLSANRLPKGTGVEHLNDSNITDTGTVVSVNSNTAVTGSFTVTIGSAVEFQVTNTGVNLGNALTDIHNVTGSLRVTGSVADPAMIVAGNTVMTGSLTVTGGVTTATELQVTTTGVNLGNISTDVHNVTGSLRVSGSSTIVGNTAITGSTNITGSLTVTTTGTELQVTSTGVNLGNIVTDVHNVTGSLLVSGSLTVSGTTTTTTLVETSALRYKENISDIQSADVIYQLRPVSFDWKSNHKPDIGFIAEEVNSLIPILTELNEDGEVEGVKYSKITTLLTKIVQNHLQEINTLKSNISVLVEEINNLKNK